MTSEITKKQNQISIFGEKAKGCVTDNKKIDFFDSFPEAFFIDSKDSTLSIKKTSSKDLDDAFYVYANMKKMNEQEFERFKNREWTEYPKLFKIFLFDFCILNGENYSQYFSNQKKEKYGVKNKN